MASVWSGSISFGMVAIPISLHTAVKDDKISFRMLRKEVKGKEVTLTPVGYQKVSKKTGESLTIEDTVKGYEYEKNAFVEITPEDLKEAAQKTLDTFDIEDFVPEVEIDPRFYEKPYFIVPKKGADKAFVLLRDTMKETGKVGIGRFTMKNKQHLGSIKARGDTLVLNILRFENELVSEASHNFPKEVDLRPQEVSMAKQLIGQLSTSFDPAKYKDEYKGNLERIIESKLKGVNASLKNPSHKNSDGIIDLMERLQQSLAAREGASRDLPSNPKPKRPKATKASDLPLEAIAKRKPATKKKKSDSSLTA
ncbi:MAG: Ku protein [Proteobacteria bacterium]|nr:MAG: Ku protein [Pseudomonadota bacterium]